MTNITDLTLKLLNLLTPPTLLAMQEDIDNALANNATLSSDLEYFTDQLDCSVSPCTPYKEKPCPPTTQ